MLEIFLKKKKLKQINKYIYQVLMKRQISDGFSNIQEWQSFRHSVLNVDLMHYLNIRSFKSDLRNFKTIVTFSVK